MKRQENPPAYSEFPTEPHLEEARRGLVRLLTRNLIFSYAPASPDSRLRQKGVNFTLRLGYHDPRVIHLGVAATEKVARARRVAYPLLPVLVINPAEELPADRLADQIATLAGSYLVAGTLKSLTDKGRLTDWRPYRPESQKPSPGLIHPAYHLRDQNQAEFLISVALNLTGSSRPLPPTPENIHPVHLLAWQSSGRGIQPVWAANASIEQAVIKIIEKQ